MSVRAAELEDFFAIGDRKRKWKERVAKMGKPEKVNFT